MEKTLVGNSPSGVTVWQALWMCFSVKLGKIVLNNEFKSLEMALRVYSK